ncbi:hypothetical protein EYD25_20790 [Klebsiella pneumoniae]|jgi:hypothetical protein|uniref:Uncharacterized protein n=3 Tax=Klebsiella pneumoniae complex TaxID=3390273 RepID=A0ABY6X5V8_9ENTR|nr:MULTISPECIES: hypothetical protein [Klebsiella]HDS2602157.1 hypothetical protein [Klebsiella pneumoniae subsp. pneumoniae]EIW8629439.1 hypothetical protein [Klebsiella pneumoniae]MBZ7800447.1 hypothetical protein [Klebsiella pneumoniae]TAI02057.1 hypothetical protein EYD25_20790 [Klebsiella pneumoniae]SAQ48127.1 Uncharacterised protein [Klebsiella oxytoca]
MTVTRQKPEVSSGTAFKNRDMVTHPAFGLVRVGRVNSSGTNLFDSDIDHRELIELTFHTAAIEQDGYSNRVTKGEDRSPLLVARLSAAQWAAMVSSFGVGEGVPCTLSKIRDGKLVHLPEIEKSETMHERFSNDIAARVRKDITRIEAITDKLGSLIASGKIGKRDLRDIYDSLSSAVNNLPGNMAFGAELTQEAVDKIVASGKAEVEAYIAGAAMRLGLEQMVTTGPELNINEDILKMLESKNGA